MNDNGSQRRTGKIKSSPTTADSRKPFYQKYRDSILFNKNLLIADTCSLFVSAFLAEIFFKFINPSYIDDSIFTAIVEYCVDTPIFFLLYYIDNRHKYVITEEAKEENNYNNINLIGTTEKKKDKKKKDTIKIKNDIKKMLGIFSLCDVTYVIIKIFVQYQLLQQTNLQPYQAAMVSSLIGWAAFLILINLTMKAVRIFKKDEIVWYYVLILAISISNSVIFFSNLDLRALYDNAIIDVSAAIAVSSGLIVVFRQKIIHKIYDKTFSSVAIGLVLWFTAEIIWTYYQLGLGIDNPFPSIADAFWLIGYGFLIYHVYRIFNSIRSGIPKTTIDTSSDKSHRPSLIVIISVIAATIMASSYLVGSVIFGGTNPFSQGKDEIIKLLISIAYPILDAILLVPAATILWNLRRADPAFTHWILICSFIIMSTIGDVGFAYTELINEDIAQKQVWIWDTFFNAGYICIASALLWYNKFFIVPAISVSNATHDNNNN